MTEEIIKRYRVLKELPRSFVLIPQHAVYEGDMVIRAGEVCEYFEHTDVYCLPVRQGIVPFVKRKHVEQWADYFEPVTTEGAESTEKGPEPRRVQGKR